MADDKKKSRPSYGSALDPTRRGSAAAPNVTGPAIAPPTPTPGTWSAMSNMPSTIAPTVMPGSSVAPGDIVPTTPVAEMPPTYNPFGAGAPQGFRVREDPGNSVFSDLPDYAAVFPYAKEGQFDSSHARRRRTPGDVFEG